MTTYLQTEDRPYLSTAPLRGYLSTDPLWVPGGGSAPASSKLASDVAALHATYGDEFLSATLAGKWTRRNVNPGDITLQTDREYDASVLSITMEAGDAIYQAVPAGDFTQVLTCHGASLNGGMNALFVVDSSGNGYGFSPYNDTSSYLWVIVAWNYSSTGPILGGSVPWQYGTPDRPYVLKFKKVGGVYTGYVSGDGGAHFLSVSGTPSAFTPAFMGFGRLFGGGTMTWQVGRYNILVP